MEFEELRAAACDVELLSMHIKRRARRSLWLIFDRIE